MKRRLSTKTKIEIVQMMFENAQGIVDAYLSGNTALAEKLIDELVDEAETTLSICAPERAIARFG